MSNTTTTLNPSDLSSKESLKLVLMFLGRQKVGVQIQVTGRVIRYLTTPCIMYSYDESTSDSSSSDESSDDSSSSGDEYPRCPRIATQQYSVDRRTGETKFACGCHLRYWRRDLTHCAECGIRVDSYDLRHCSTKFKAISVSGMCGKCYNETHIYEDNEGEPSCAHCSWWSRRAEVQRLMRKIRTIRN